MQNPILRRATTLLVGVVLTVTATWIVAAQTGAETTSAGPRSSASGTAGDTTLKEYFLPTHKWREDGTATTDIPALGDTTLKEYFLPRLTWMGRRPNGNSP
jgi:hypothetical protein